MYTFRTETDFESFDRFVEEHHGQYQQCSLWPKVKTAWTPHFYAGFDEAGERVLTCLVLERGLPVAGKLWYVPYGTVSDITNEALQKEFATFIAAEMKAHKAFCTIIDPPVPLRTCRPTPTSTRYRPSSRCGTRTGNSSPANSF